MRHAWSKSRSRHASLRHRAEIVITYLWREAGNSCHPIASDPLHSAAACVGFAILKTTLTYHPAKHSFTRNNLMYATYPYNVNIAIIRHNSIQLVDMWLSCHSCYANTKYEQITIINEMTSFVLPHEKRQHCQLQEAEDVDEDNSCEDAPGAGWRKQNEIYFRSHTWNKSVQCGDRCEVEWGLYDSHVKDIRTVECYAVTCTCTWQHRRMCRCTYMQSIMSLYGCWRMWENMNHDGG